MKICGIYKITSPSGKVYIGQAVDIMRRWQRYRGYDSKGQPRLHRSLKKHGAEKHKFDILCQCDKSELSNLEVYYIELFQCFNSEMGLNLRGGGERGGAISEETRKKISNSVSGEKNGFFGKTHSEETRKKLREAARKRKETLGYMHSPEAREKMSLTRKGRKDHLSREKRLEIVERARQAGLKRKELTGHYISPERQKIMHDAQIGKPKHTEEHKKMMSILLKGRIVSEETKAKMRKPKTKKTDKNILYKVA